MKRIFATLLIPTALLTTTAFADSGEELGISGFSGLPSAIPREGGTRNSYFKAKAYLNRQKSQGLRDGPEFRRDISNRALGFNPSQAYNDVGGLANDCSINIGNIIANNKNNPGQQETMVIIEGDVINAGNCR